MESYDHLCVTGDVIKNYALTEDPKMQRILNCYKISNLLSGNECGTTWSHIQKKTFCDGLLI